MNALRWLLFPFSLLYGIIAALRNFLYDYKILKSTRFNIPVVVVGNLSMGGTGKSPMIEYLIRLLQDSYSIGVVSRGYGRKSKGILEVEASSSALLVGDEPLQFKTKFPDLPVWVAERRTEGIKALRLKHPATNLILLDDAFQHRRVDPALAIVLMEYKDVLSRQYPIPMGRLREWIGGLDRADVVVITKCPKVLSQDEQRRIQKRLQLSNDIDLYFSSIEYGAPVSITKHAKPISLSKEVSVLAFTGIANPDPMLKYLRTKVKSLETMRFSDHHVFTKSDVLSIRRSFEALDEEQKILICTEKDSMRIRNEELMLHLENLPLYYLPIETVLQTSSQNGFDDRIQMLLNYH